MTIIKAIKKMIPLNVKKSIKKFLLHPNAIASSATIEISGFCNALCPYCITGRTSMKDRSHNFMTPSLFKEIAIRIKRDKLLMHNNFSLINWGEAILNPNFIEIVNIAGSLGIQPSFSTNAYAYVDIPEKTSAYISGVNFSLSGMTQDSYAKIHGLNLSTVLENIKKYCKSLKNSNRQMSFHIYKYTNMNEYLLARDFCTKNGIHFMPYCAYFNDFDRGLSYLEGSLEQPVLEKANEELVLFYLEDLFSKKPKDYCCPQFDMITIDESGNLLTCCCLPRGHKSYALGHFLDLSAKEIMEKKRSQQVCEKCNLSGVSYWAHNPFFVSSL